MPINIEKQYKPLDSSFSGYYLPLYNDSSKKILRSSEIYRNENNQITGIKYENEFIKIYRNSVDKITGIYYNNWYKKILYDESDMITGLKVYYY